MILDIVQYGHPALRAKGSRVETVTPELRELVADMLETMYDADGVGLAAQQIGRPLQLCVIDVAGVSDRPSALRINGEPVEIDDHMPMVLINPEIEPFGRTKAGPEGCLSFPGLRGDIARPQSVRVRATDLEGRTITFEADGLLARAVQHEFDHLQGVLFIDRMDAAERKDALRDLEDRSPR
jgi:peptide deformylase